MKIIKIMENTVKVYLMSMSFFLPICALNAQNTPVIIENCNGERTKRSDFLEKSVLFNVAGIDLNK